MPETAQRPALTSWDTGAAWECASQGSRTPKFRRRLGIDLLEEISMEGRALRVHEMDWQAAGQRRVEEAVSRRQSRVVFRLQMKGQKKCTRSHPQTSLSSFSSHLLPLFLEGKGPLLHIQALCYLSPEPLGQVPLPQTDPT